jgi:hypothetical protein
MVSEIENYIIPLKMKPKQKMVLYDIRPNKIHLICHINTMTSMCYLDQTVEPWRGDAVQVSSQRTQSHFLGPLWPSSDRLVNSRNALEDIEREVMRI